MTTFGNMVIIMYFCSNCSHGSEIGMVNVPLYAIKSYWDGKEQRTIERTVDEYPLAALTHGKRVVVDEFLVLQQSVIYGFQVKLYEVRGGCLES